MCACAAAIVALMPAAAAAGHGSVSYENQLKLEQKKRKSQAPAAAPAAPPASPAAQPPPVATTGDRDHHFATAMRRHHAEAARLAQDEVENGTDPQLKALASRMLEIHRDQLAELDRWLSEHPAPRAAK